MAEATSHCFVARAGAAGPDLEARSRQWASSSCVEHGLSRDEGGQVSLYVMRRDPKTARALQSLLQTLTARWGMSLGRLGGGWLRLISLEEFRAAVPAGGVAEDCTACCTPEHPADAGGATAQCAPPALRGGQPLAVHECGTHLLRLSPGFDERSQATLAILRAQAAC